MLSDSCLSVCPVLSSVCLTLLHCSQTVGWIKVKLGMQVALGPGHIVLHGDPAPLPKGHSPPIFRPYLLWPNGWMDQDATWHGGRPRPRRHCARWTPSSPKTGDGPQFSAHVYCGEMAGRIKMRLGTEVGLGSGNILLDGNPAPPKRAQPPFSGPCLLWPNGWMNQDTTWYAGRPQPRRHCVRW